MAFNNSFTAVVGATYTASQYNTYVRDNFTAIWVGTTAGDTEYYTSSSAKARVAIGANGTYYESNGSVPSWTKFYRSTTFLLNTDTALTVGDNAYRWRVPAYLNGWNIYSVAASRLSGTGILTIQIRNATDAVDILSTKLTVDSGETDSLAAATPPVINTAVDDLATGDQIATDVDVAGTSTLYAQVELVFAKP